MRLSGTVQAHAALAPRALLTPYCYEPAALGDDEVELVVEACALCHSDVHLIDDDWGISRYPLVPGHEVVGRIASLGAGVTGFAVGQRVGVGWQRGACGSCGPCSQGLSQLCTRSKRRTCVDQPGGFAERVRTSAAFAFAIPPELPSTLAAPLLCAGVTVFAPLLRHLGKSGVRPDGGRLRVGIVGLGGLGHLAVQFASAFGCEVVAFDPAAAKAEEAAKLGAAAFVATGDTAELARHGELDFVLSTTSADLDWNFWLSLLALNGTLCLVGVPARPLVIAPDHLLDGQKRVTGSVVGSPDDIRQTLAFAAAHGVRPLVETLPMTRVNEALARVRAGAARYRMVLEADF